MTREAGKAIPPVDLSKGRARFPWRDWFGRKELVLVRGYHWKGLAGSFTITLRKAAAIHNKRVSIRVLADGEVLDVRVFDRPPAKSRRPTKPRGKP